MNLSKSLMAFAAAVPALLTTAAKAEDRTGVTFGVALGGGTLSCSSEGCEELNGAGSFDLHVGGMLNPKLAAIGEVWWMVHTASRLTVDQGLVTAALRFWPLNHFWLQGGLGVGRSGYSYDANLVVVADHTEWVPAFQIGIGVEPIATPTFGLEIALRYGTGFYSNGDHRIHSAALTVGVSFY